jgi:hypothetical protein
MRKGLATLGRHSLELWTLMSMRSEVIHRRLNETKLVTSIVLIGNSGAI